MPRIGEIKRAKELERKGGNNYIWHACVDCRKERWVFLKRGQPISSKCRKCGHLGIPHLRGPLNKRWKGGRNLRDTGYWEIWVPRTDFFYPMARKRGYVLEHRLVMAKHLGRNLHRWEIVHHRNHIRGDNRIENLQLVSDDRHRQISVLERLIESLQKENKGLKNEIRRLKNDHETKAPLPNVR